jgi:hypothetical protein
MSCVSARLRASSGNRHGETTLISAAVAIGVIAGWLAYDHWVYPRVIRRLINAESIHTMTWFYLYSLVDAVVRYFGPYALVLLLWGRTGHRGVGAAVCALATGMYMWGLWVVFDKWIWGDNATAAQVNLYEWANLLVVSTGIALAWGIARRWGRIWMIGLLTAPILAGLTHELAIHSSWWRNHLLFDDNGSHDFTRQLVFIAPAVIAAVICWLIEVLTTRRTVERLPEPGSGANGIPMERLNNKSDMTAHRHERAPEPRTDSGRSGHL